jgi:hypothetical protein
MVRKGSLQLSINAIVILIMAIAMLGVGIFFINTVVKGELGTITGLSGDVKDQIKSQLQQSGEKIFLSGVSSGELVIGQNKEQTISVVIMNQQTSAAGFNISVTQIKEDANGNTNLDLTEFYQNSTQFIEVGEIGEILVTFDTSSKRGRVIYTIDVNQVDTAGTVTRYGSETFHLVVK